MPRRPVAERRRLLAGLVAVVALAACTRAPSPAAPTPTPGQTPGSSSAFTQLVALPGEPNGRLGIVDQSGLFSTGTSSDQSGPHLARTWVEPVPGAPDDVLFGWQTPGPQDCYLGPPVLTIDEPTARSLRFTFGFGTPLYEPCLPVGSYFAVRLHFTVDVSGYTLSAELAPEQTPPPSPSP